MPNFSIASNVSSYAVSYTTPVLVARYIYILAMIILLVMYAPRLVCWGYARYKQKKLVSEKKNRIALIVPARNESMSIGGLLKSVTEQTYPSEYFDLHIIVADENDKTIEMVKAVGGTTYVVADQTCKGDALDAALKTILAKDPDYYDAYIIIDADCVLDKRYCEEMNNALSKGADVYSSKKLVKNYYFGDGKVPMSAACNGIIWTLIDNMGNTYKSEHSLPCFTVGTGLMLTSGVVKTLGGWPYKATVTEDVELMQDSVVRGFKFSYYQHAIIYMEEATKLEVTNKRRRRWMTGVVDSGRIYSGEFEKMPNRREESANIYHVTCLNRVYAMIGIPLVFSIINTVLSLLLLIVDAGAARAALANAFMGVGFIYSAFFVMTLVALIGDWENIKLPFMKKILLLFVHPIFYMKYIEIVATAIFTKKGRKWDVIERVDFGQFSEKKGR